MKFFKKLSLMICILLLPLAAFAEDNEEELKAIEITATRTTLKEENKTSAVTVITQEEIQQKQHMQVQDILREQLGIQVVRSGPLGGQTSVFMRGANSASTLVMIDGVQVNSNTTGAFNFANLQLDNIERIEILRGPQSALWGADAVGGVINIVTKRGKGKPTHSLTFEGGSFETFKETITSSGALGKFDYSLSASRTDSDSFSDLNEDRGATEDDGYGNTSLSTRLGYNFLGNGRIEVISRYVQAKNDFDRLDPITFAFTDSSIPQITNDKFSIAIPIQKSLTDKWDVKLNSNFSYDKLDTIDPTIGDSAIFNRTYTVDFQNNVTLSDYISTVFGFEYQVTNSQFTGQGNPLLFFAPDQFGLDNHSQGYYLEGRLNYEDQLFLTAGLRQEINSEFEDKLIYKIEAAYHFKETGTKVRVSHATGFRVPSHQELFFPFFGNPNLLPEKSTNWEGGIEQKLFNDRLTLSVTYFYTEYTDLIDSNLSTGFFASNIGLAISQGVESSINLEILNDLDLTVLHTWNQAVDEIRDVTLAKRPRNTFSATLSHSWLKKLYSLVTVQYRSRMVSGLGPVKGRTLLRAAISYQLNKNWKLTARGENLLDKDYEESFESGTAGISGYAGFVYSFN